MNLHTGCQSEWLISERVGWHARRQVEGMSDLMGERMGRTRTFVQSSGLAGWSETMWIGESKGELAGQQNREANTGRRTYGQDTLAGNPVQVDEMITTVDEIT